MKKSIRFLVLAVALLGAFLGGMRWEYNQRTADLMDRWNDMWGWTEAEREEFFELTRGLDLKPKDYIEYVESIAAFDNAVAEMMANDDAIATLYCLTILNLIEDKKYDDVRDFCISRIRTYYQREADRLPPMLKEGRVSLLTRIEDEASKHPQLYRAIHDNQPE